MTQTNWELIHDAASGSSTAKRSLDAVMKRAWPAVYAYIRASGRRSEEATELTQAFLCDVFLARRLLDKADESRGRFRTLLLGAVRNHLADVHRRATAAIRKPKEGLIALDAHESPLGTASAASSSPERAFNTRYVAELIRSASDRLHRELEAEGMPETWEIFRVRVLHAAFQGEAPPYEAIAARLGLTKGACAVRLLIAKRRFATILMEELRATITDPADLSNEVTDLLSLLNAE